MKSPDSKVPIWWSTILSLWTWLIVIIVSVIVSLTSLVTVLPVSLLLDRDKRRLMHGVAVQWGKILLAICPYWSLRIDGHEFVKKNRTYVIVANHQSMLDILVLLASLPVHFKFMAKRELMPVPIIGWHMALAGYVRLDRESKESGKQALLKSREWLRKGVSILMFPEGTRSMDGKVHTFKVGAFKLAVDEHVEILPVAIDGTGDAIPKKSWRLNKESRFVVSIGKPVKAKIDEKCSIEDLRDAVQREIAQRLQVLRSEL